MLLTVRDACRPHSNTLRADPEPDVEDIAEVIRAAEGDIEAFFGRNHVTRGMRELFELGVARLDGRSDQAVYTLTQSMGGGKTHVMVAFGLIVKSAALRQRVLDAAGIRAPSGFGDARVVAFSGRNNPTHYIWGEIAMQLGKGDAFAKFWQAGPKAPDELDWRSLIGDEPTLILLDELPPWFDNAQTVVIGQGTLANVATYALANLVSAVNKLPRACVIISNLSAAYQGASRNLANVLSNLSQEVSRGAKEITPVALNSDEVFAILRRRLFAELPERRVIDDVATEYARAMDEAVRSRMVAKTPEQFVEEINRCYPFHPRLRDLVALFRNNERFRQTRGLLRLVSRVVRNVWDEARPNNVHLIGVQHMDLNDPNMRNEILPLSDLQDAVAVDVADDGQAHAETIDAELGSDAGTQVANVTLAASLMRGLDAKPGLTRDQVIECVTAPGRSLDEFGKAFDALIAGSWHLHRGNGDTFYFAPGENITKRLQSEAERAPQPRIDQNIADRLRVVFGASASRAYQEVLALPDVGQIDLSGSRKLIIISPDSRMPPDVGDRLLAGFAQKNNFLVVTGSATYFASLDGAMRRLYAAEKVLTGMAADDPLREDVEDRAQECEFDFLTTVEQAFNRIWYPGRKPDRTTGLIEARLELRTARGTGNQPSTLAGEAAVEAALARAGKLVGDPETRADMLRDRIENQLWPQGGAFKVIPWRDIVDRAKERPEFVWLPPGGLDGVRQSAVTRGVWRQPEPSKIERGPFETDKTRVSWTEDPRDPDTGEVWLTIQAIDAGPSPRIHWAEGTDVTAQSPELPELRFKTGELRHAFLAVDPTGEHPTGEPRIWRNRITIQHRVISCSSGKMVELFARPSAVSLRYTVGGASVRDSGLTYNGPFPVTATGEAIVRALAVDGDIEGEEIFRIRLPADQGQGGGGGEDRPPTVREFVDEARPAVLRMDIRRTSTPEVFTLAGALGAAGAAAQVGSLNIGEGQQTAMMRLGSEIRLTGDAITTLIQGVRDVIGQANATVTAQVQEIRFPTGRDLMGFVDELRLDIPDPRDCISQPEMAHA